MLFTIERIHNSLEKQQTENRNLLVVNGGKGLTAFHLWNRFPTAVTYRFDENNEDDIHGL
jgi:hypothetical protein